ncbi:hypothetical protein BRARA_A02420 [Brassica rapa]|uniref:Ubiquitin-like protease family profile domain-containing protein n=1 Tax=Brassica campestris TaxID=3711 RepID=A0A398AWH7_BRACM|nr:hypothetical protein BRARA_A02420 [Brassica rapa]
MLNKILRSIEDDCCIVILKDNSDDFQEVFYEVLHYGRFPGSLPEDFIADFLEFFTSNALHADEYKELKESKLGMFIKFKELDFGWASRLVHYMLGFQLDIKKKYELWSLVGPQPVRFALLEFEHLTGLNCDYIEDMKNPRCENYPWGRVSFKVLMESPKGKDFQQHSYTVDGFIQVLQVWTYYALPEFGASYGNPIPNRPSPLLLAYKGGKGHKVTGTKPSVKKEVSAAETESGVKEESGRPQKKALKEKMTKEDIEKSFRDIADVMRDGFEMFLKEIKSLGDMMEAVEKKNDAQEPSSSKELRLVIAKEPEVKPYEQSGEPSVLVLGKGAPTVSDLQQGEARRQTKKAKAMEFVREKSERERKLAASQQSPFKGNNTAKLIIPNKRVGQGYDPFAPFDKKMSKVLTDWLKLDLYYETPLDKKPRRCPRQHMDAFINLLRQWYQDDPKHFRSERLCFLNHVFSRPWSHKYPEFKSDEGDLNGLGRRLPTGVWIYHACIVPTFFQSLKHWIAMWISIPKRHIVVWDSIVPHISREDLELVMEPFVTMVPYMLVECAATDEQRVQHILEPYTYERVTIGVPQCRACDCGVFTLKYIECHALGMSFPPEFCNKNVKAIREKMALDIVKETPEYTTITLLMFQINNTVLFATFHKESPSINLLDRHHIRYLRLNRKQVFNPLTMLSCQTQSIFSPFLKPP